MADQPQPHAADLPGAGLQLRNKTPKRKVKAKLPAAAAVVKQMRKS